MISKSTKDAKRHTSEEKASRYEEEEGEESGFYNEKFNIETNFGRI